MKELTDRVCLLATLVQITVCHSFTSRTLSKHTQDFEFWTLEDTNIMPLSNNITKITSAEGQILS